MGYSASGGPKGLGVFNNTPQTAADLNQLVALIARGGNYRGPLTEAERDAISGAALFAGLMVYNTTKSQLEIFTGAGWQLIWNDTGWQTLPLASGWTVESGDTPQYRVRAGYLSFRGRLDATTGAPNLPFTINLPVGARPSRAVPQLIGTTGGSGAQFVMNVGTDGEITIFKFSNAVNDIALSGFVPFLLA
jgi:hypothetical protein